MQDEPGTKVKKKKAHKSLGFRVWEKVALSK
jgi:hypothetical protein